MYLNYPQVNQQVKNNNKFYFKVAQDNKSYNFCLAHSPPSEMNIPPALPQKVSFLVLPSSVLINTYIC